MISIKIINNRLLYYSVLLIGFISLDSIKIQFASGLLSNGKDSSVKIPEILDVYPLNESITRGTKAVFHCHVFSEEYPTINWLRYLPDFQYKDYKNIHPIVYYSGHAYELLTSVREKPAARNVYISKLIINDTRLEDEGCYACVAISLRGHNIRKAFLNVYVQDNKDDSKEYWSDYETEDDLIAVDSTKFCWFFLMPVVFTLLTLSVWLSYIIENRWRQHSLKEQKNYSDKYDEEYMERILEILVHVK